MGPFVLSFSLYWLPAIFKASSSSQYGSWAKIVIYPWTLAGILTMAVGLLVFLYIERIKND